MTTIEAPHPLLEWTLADRLRKAREAAGLSKAQLAAVGGITRETVGFYESNESTRKRPLVFIVNVYAAHTPATLEWLLGDDVEWPEDDDVSAPPGIRTQNLRIKSPLLCR